MRILVLGAGALGGYFGARLIEAGNPVDFLVRPRRAAQLATMGLVVESAFGGFARPVTAVVEAGPGYDAVLLGCKAYDLEEAIAAVRPAVAAGAVVLPVLNGIGHVARLQAAFGAGSVLGGLAKIQAVLGSDGVIRQLNDWRYLTFGEVAGGLSPRAEALRVAFAGAPGVVVEAVPDVMARMWEKFVHLGTSAVATVLMRTNVGEIARAPGGVALMLRVLERNMAIAAWHGFPVRDGFGPEYTRVFSDTGSGYSTSMLRDLEAGGRIESDHVLGDLLAAARRAGVEDALHEAAYISAKSYEQRRDAGRLR